MMIRRLFGMMDHLPGHSDFHSSFQHAPSSSAKPSVSDLDEIYVAALFSTIVNEMPRIEDALIAIDEYLEEEIKATVPLDGELGAKECGIVSWYGNKIVLAFGATDGNKD
ncbi:hypothetical protein NliqN6_3825 [Naganishia liquefaciens]|uniref:Uncharacterized protein n=1 Tax=Naganishia liquefaciens TaxID=104408 RepID=A0A8H3TV19_9TREE|nr:hypothetical protein NliqN6_3825 [Naganishia liquefaciens]